MPSAAQDCWINVSHGLGFPLGGLGSGYSALGKYGLVRQNFEGRPQDGLRPGQWEYTQADALRMSEEGLKQTSRKLDDLKQDPNTEPAALEKAQKLHDEAVKLAADVRTREGFVKSTYGFVIRENDKQYLLQVNPATWTDATPFESAKAYAYLPKGRVEFTDSEAQLKVTVLGFTPLLPHDIETATLPVQVFDIKVENTGNIPRSLTLTLENGQPNGRAMNNMTLFPQKAGQIAFAADGGTGSERGVSVTIQMSPGDTQTARFYLTWHYPKIDWYKRYYTKAHENAISVLATAQQKASAWSERIDAWHDSIQAPVYLKRLWFSSLASVMTSTYMSSDPYFMEIETPHPCLNTMDVCVYSNWVYMINWPQLERMDIDQYFKTMPVEGPRAGLVWHSLWEDGAHYVEEPTFLVRFRRDALWFNDPEWTKKGFPYMVRAANKVFREGSYEYLVESKHGNQSYDVWKMPGVSSYVNTPWLYGLRSLKNVAQSIGAPEPKVGDLTVSELLDKATASFDKLLWNENTKSWNLFFRTPSADKGSTPESLFTDQLFGLWVVAIDADTTPVLSNDKINTTLHTLYTHNLLEDPAQGFRGWVNGMKPGRVPDTDTGYHARTCWFGAQFNLGSLLGYVGDEKASLDVMASVEKSLRNDHMAAGEWNRTINSKGGVEPLPYEICKDTPRFAPYPRYKSSWEFIVRLVGLTLDEKTLALSPFKTVDLEFKDIELAGMQMKIKVEAGWTRALVNGQPAALPVKIHRTEKQATVEFLK